MEFNSTGKTNDDKSKTGVTVGGMNIGHEANSTRIRKGEIQKIKQEVIKQQKAKNREARLNTKTMTTNK